MRSVEEKKGSSSLPEAFLHARQGIAHSFVNGRNFKIEVGVAILAIFLGLLLGISSSEWLAIVISIGVVLASECLNTAMEALVDKVSPEHCELARIAKDCSAGAVLVLSVTSLAIAAMVYLPHIMAFFSRA